MSFNQFCKIRPAAFFILALLFVSCQAKEKPKLPTRMATAEAVEGLQSPPEAVAVAIPGTYTPLPTEPTGGQPAWEALQPTAVTNPTTAASNPKATGSFPAASVQPTTQTADLLNASPFSQIVTPSPTATPFPTLTDTPQLPTATALPPSPTPPQSTATSPPPSPTLPVEPTAVPSSPGLSPVYREAVYPVQVIQGVIYGQGLRRNSWTDPLGQVMNLTLDIYMPPAGSELRPSILLYHGGGFQGGGSEFPNMVQTAEYFAARGWVIFVANYRLEEDHGSAPADWPEEPGAMIYPAGRDAKAAVRWVHANAAQYNVSPEHITAFGGSAGAMLALMLGVSDASDYRDELDLTEDPTLATTNLNASAEVQTVVFLWGSDVLLSSLEVYDGRNRYDAGDTPTLLIHGSEDNLIPLSEAERIYFTMLETGIPVDFQILIGEGHSAWEAVLEDGRTIYEGAFDFIVAHQGLGVVD